MRLTLIADRNLILRSEKFERDAAGRSPRRRKGDS